MKTNLFAGIMAVVGLAGCAWAQDEEARLNNTLANMKAELQLTQEQVSAVRPVMQEYDSRRQELKQRQKEDMSIDDQTIADQTARLNEEEAQALGKVLDPEQMKKWKNKQRMRSALNSGGRSADTGWAPRDTQTGVGIGF